MRDCSKSHTMTRGIHYDCFHTLPVTGNTRKITSLTMKIIIILICCEISVEISEKKIQINQHS